MDLLLFSNWSHKGNTHTLFVDREWMGANHTLSVHLLIPQGEEQSFSYHRVLYYHIVWISLLINSLRLQFTICNWGCVSPFLINYSTGSVFFCHCWCSLQYCLPSFKAIITCVLLWELWGVSRGHHCSPFLPLSLSLPFFLKSRKLTMMLQLKMSRANI